MENAPVILIIGAEGPREAEEEWNKYYNEKHVPDMLKFKGIKKVSRYKKVDDTETAYPKYIAVYEFENSRAAEAYKTSPERDAAAKDWADTSKKWGVETKWRVSYEAIKAWQR